MGQRDTRNHHANRRRRIELSAVDRANDKSEREERAPLAGYEAFYEISRSGKVFPRNSREVLIGGYHHSPFIRITVNGAVVTLQKAKAIADLRGAEAKANGAPFAADAVANAVPWWDGPKPTGHVEGLLKQVDCIGKQARIVVERDGHKLIRLLVRDPSQVVFIGGGEQTLTCGPQKPVRATVEFIPKSNAKLGTSGEVATIEFHR